MFHVVTLLVIVLVTDRDYNTHRPNFISFVTFSIQMPPKHSSPASGGRHSVHKKFTPTKEVQAKVLTPLKQNDASKVKVSTASTIGSTLSRSTVGHLAL